MYGRYWKLHNPYFRNISFYLKQTGKWYSRKSNKRNLKGSRRYFNILGRNCISFFSYSKRNSLIVSILVLTLSKHSLIFLGIHRSQFQSPGIFYSESGYPLDFFILLMIVTGTHIVIMFIILVRNADYYLSLLYLLIYLINIYKRKQRCQNNIRKTPY